MSFLNGCQEGKATPRLEEILCPKCGEIMEVFVGMGSGNAGVITADAVCDACGCTIAAGAMRSDYQSA